MKKRVDELSKFNDDDFKKSSFSYPPPKIQHCVEVAIGETTISVRDSKDPSGPRLDFTPAEWRAFLKGAKKGEFDV